MSVHFKLKSEIDYDTYSFEGNFISVGELKKYIQKKRLGKSTDFDLLLTNSQTNEEYKDETLMIPKNTSIIVSRIPISNTSRFQHSTPVSTPASNVPAPLIIANGEGTEGVDQEDLKINALLQTSVISNSGGYNKHHGGHNREAHHYGNRSEGSGGSGNNGAINSSGSGQNGKSQPEKSPHPSYICHRCNQTGHFINQCPTNGDPKFDKQKMKKPSGIPVTFLKPLQPSTTQTPMGPSTVLMPGGGVAVVLTNESQFNKMAKTIISTTEEAKKQKQLQTPSTASSTTQPLSPTSTSSSKVDELESFNIEECKKCNKLSSNGNKVKGIKANCCLNEICFDCIETNIINMNKKTCPLCFCPFDVSESGEEGVYSKNGIPAQFYNNKKRELDQQNSINNNDENGTNKKRFKTSHTEYNNESVYQKPKFNNYHQEKYYRGGDQRFNLVEGGLDYRYPDAPYPPYPYPDLYGAHYYDPQLHQAYYGRNGYRDEDIEGGWPNEERDNRGSRDGRDRDYRDRDRSRERDRSRDRSRDRDRDRRDKESSSSRRDDRDRDRDRDYKNSSSSGRDRDRDRDRERDYKSGSGRDRDYKSSSGERDRDRDRDHKSSSSDSRRDRDDRRDKDYKESSTSRSKEKEKDYRSSSSSKRY